MSCDEALGPEACNYDSQATQDDGSCEYEVDDCPDCAGVPYGDSWVSDCGCVVVDNSGDDCAGTPNGDLEYDECGVCDGDSSSCVCDYDDNCYEVIQIGDQLWMSENLKVTHYNDGSDIPTGYSNFEWTQLQTGAYAVYDDAPANLNTYGNLYNWYTVDDDRGVCPEGFHVPSDNEYTNLINYLGGTSVAGGKMKETGLDHWNSPNTGATNESGFTCLPAGNRSSYNGTYYSMGNYGSFWSSSESNSNDAWYRDLNYLGSLVYRTDDSKQLGFSVRCLGD